VDSGIKSKTLPEKESFLPGKPIFCGIFPKNDGN
jgi:hypothetical protein